MYAVSMSNNISTFPQLYPCSLTPYSRRISHKETICWERQRTSKLHSYSPHLMWVYWCLAPCGSEELVLSRLTSNVYNTSCGSEPTVTAPYEISRTQSLWNNNRRWIYLCTPYYPISTLSIAVSTLSEGQTFQNSSTDTWFCTGTHQEHQPTGRRAHPACKVSRDMMQMVGRGTQRLLDL